MDAVGIGSERSPQQQSEIIQNLIELDLALSTTMTSHVMRRASFVQGSGMLRAFTASFPELSFILKPLKRQLLKKTVMTGIETGHAVTIFGAVCGLLKVADAKTTGEMFIYMTARDMVSAAIRLNLVGPLEGGFYVNELCKKGSVLSFDKDGSGLTEIDIKSAHQVAPLVEIVSPGFLIYYVL